MPYYAVGDYYGRGDYYRGDPGLFGAIGKALKGVGRLAVGAARGFITGGPLGAITGGARALLPSAGAGPVLMAAEPPFPAPGAGFQAVGPFGTGIAVGRFGPGPAGLPRGAGLGLRRRRINPMNVKALRRASRRIDGFARTARKALKHTPFVLVSRASRGRGGSPGVITRAEAARALRK